jgi:hypothetical protein
VRSIFKLPYDTSSSDLLAIALAYQLENVQTRMFSLNKAYIGKTINFSNPLIVQLIDEYTRGFGGGRPITKPTPLCPNRLTIDEFFNGIEIFNE